MTVMRQTQGVEIEISGRRLPASCDIKEGYSETNQMIYDKNSKIEE